MITQDIQIASSVGHHPHSLDVRSKRNGVIATTGLYPIYKVIDGQKVFTREYEQRYMNDKVEMELVEFK